MKLEARTYRDDPRLTEVEARLVEAARSHYGDLELLKRTEDSDLRALQLLAVKEDYGALFCHWFYLKTARGDLGAAHLQEALRCVWRQEATEEFHRQEVRSDLLAEAGSVEELERWCALAAFDLSGLPEEFDAWRVSHGSSPDEIAVGHGWFLNREHVVCLGWMRPQREDRVLVRRRVRHADVSIWLRDDVEEVLLLRPGPCEIDGTPEEWIQISGWYSA